jgi:hypothetical protein
MAEAYELHVSLSLAEWNASISSIHAFKPSEWLALLHSGYDTLWQVAGQLLRTRNVVASEEKWYWHNVAVFEFLGLQSLTANILVDVIAGRIDDLLGNFYTGSTASDR